MVGERCSHTDDTRADHQQHGLPDLEKQLLLHEALRRVGDMGRAAVRMPPGQPAAAAVEGRNCTTPSSSTICERLLCASDRNSVFAEAIRSGRVRELGR